jgi:hypothetical protein
VKLRDFQVVRNGNGRDFDILPRFVGSYAHGYTLSFEILQAEAQGPPVRLHSDGYYLDETSNLRVYVRQADIRQRFAGFALNRAYLVRATVALEVGFGGQAGYWSPGFLERVFPRGERAHSITRRVSF